MVLALVESLICFCARKQGPFSWAGLLEKSWPVIMPTITMTLGVLWAVSIRFFTMSMARLTSLYKLY